MWPSPLPSREFVRGFGAISRRARSISQDYLGEHRVCEARRALRFVPSGQPEFECAYRRFFFDGKVVGKFDIGLKRKSSRSPNAQATKLGEALERALTLGFSVPGIAGGERPRPLAAVGGVLAKAYLRASTVHDVSTPAFWALGGRPLVVVEYSPRDRLLLPMHVRPVPCDLGRDAFLHHYWLSLGAGPPLSCWLLSSDLARVGDAIRHLRICLAQLHATRECLELVLHSIAAGKIAPKEESDARQALQDYFDVTRRHLASVRSRSKELGAGFTAAAAEAFEQINPFSEQLLETVEKALKRLGLKYNTVKGALREVGSGTPSIRTESNPADVEHLGEPIVSSPSRSPKPEEPSVQADIVIVTALKDERDAVLSYKDGLRGEWQALRSSKGINYHLATFETLEESPRELRVVVARPGQMGEQHTVSLATRLMDLSPSLVAMSGICAGDRRHTRLGDVIVAERVFKFDHGKLKAWTDAANQRREDVFRDLTTYNLKPRLLEAAQELQGAWDRVLPTDRPITYEAQERWLLLTLANHDAKATAQHPDRRARCPAWQEVLKRLRQRKLLEPEGLKLTRAGKKWVENFELEHPDGAPADPRFTSVHIGPMATTSFVQQDPELFAAIERFMRKTLGVEMESAAIGAVAHLAELPMLVVKAVSDHGDHDKDDQFRGYAAEASAWFLLDFLRKNWADIVPLGEEKALSVG